MTLLVLLTLPYGFAQDNIVYPAAANVTDVTQPPYNADNTGAVDATAAIQAALDGPGAIVYLPNGTYLVSGTINWPGSANSQKRHILQGQSKLGTIIKLQDNASGYSNVGATKTVIYTGQAPAQRFQNYIKNLTVNTGSGNPGATGVQFIANNVGGMYDVLIKSNDGNGVYGLDLGYTDEQGPCLIKGIEVQGFDIGIRLKNGVNSVTMEDITISGQKSIGLLNDGQVLSMRKFSSNNTVTAILNKSIGMLTIFESTIVGTGTAASVPAIISTNGLFARDITTSGYLKAIENTGGNEKDVNGAIVDEFVSHDIISLFPSPLKSLNLPVLETPIVAYEDTASWGNIEDYGPPEDTTTVSEINGITRTVSSWHKAFQRAIDAGHKTIYMPAGNEYRMVGDIIVRNNVERIIGLMRAVKGTGAYSDREYGANFIIEDGTAPVVIIENFNNQYGGFDFIQNSSRTLVLRNMICDQLNVNSSTVFLEDMFFVETFVEPGAKLYARQLNMEGDPTHITNNGGTVWAMGIKTEAEGTACLTTGGGSSEILGGFVYANKDRNPDKRMFQNFDSKMSVTIGEFVIRNQAFHPFYEERSGEAKLMTRQNLSTWPAPSSPAFQVPVPYSRAGGALIPLFTSYLNDSVTTVPSAPGGLGATPLGTNEVELVWADNSTDEYGFNIEARSDTSGAVFTKVQTEAPSTTTTIVEGLSPATTYSFRVSAFNHIGQSGYSNIDTASTVDNGPGAAGDRYEAENFTSRLNGQVLSDFSGFTGTGYFRYTGFDQFIEWDTVYVPTSGVYSLDLRYSNGNIDATLLEVIVNGTSLTTLSLPSTIEWTNWQTLSYAVQLEANNNAIRLKYKTTDGSRLALDNMVVKTSNLPLAPTSLTATPLSPVSVDLSWFDRSTNEDGFVVERKAAIGELFQSVATLPAGTNTFTDTELSPNVNYYYRVYAFNNDGNSAYSIEQQALTPSVFQKYESEDNSDENGGSIATTISGFSGSGYYLIDSSGDFVEWNNVNVPLTESQPVNVVFQNTSGSTANMDLIVNGATVTSLALPSGSGWQEVAFDVPLNINSNSIRLQASGSGNVAIDYIEVGQEVAPLQPSDLDVIPVSADQNDLVWVDNSANELGFIIDRKTIASDGSEIVEEVGIVSTDVTTFSDTGLVSSTVYLYQVRAFNDAGDSFFVETTGVSLPEDNEYQAENNTSKNQGSFKSVNAGYTGTSYWEVKYSNHWFEWNNVYSEFEGEFRLNFVYSNADDTTKHTSISINNVQITVDFPSTGSWTNWDTLSVDTYLNAGNNKVRVTYLTTNRQLLTIDKMELVEPNPPTVETPDNLLVTGISTSELLVTWSDNADNEDGYVLERKLFFDPEYQTIDTLSANTESYNDSGLNSQTEYIYRLSGFDSEGSSYFATASGATLSESFVYQGEEYTSNVGGAIKSESSNYTGTGYFEFKYVDHYLEWNNTNAGFGGWYDLIFRYQNSNDTLKYTILKVNDTDVTLDFPFSGSDNSVWNTLTVPVYLKEGDNRVRLTYVTENRDLLLIDKFEVSGGLADTEAPTAPANLFALSESDSTVTLSWDAGSDNGDYLAYEILQNGIVVDTATSIPHVVEGLNASTNYAFSVRTVDGAGLTSSASNTINVTTIGSSDTQSPSVPSGLTASSVTETSFTLNWTASNDNVGVTSYEVFQDGVSIGSISNTSINVTGLSASTSYAMTVTAEDAAGNASVESTSIIVTTTTPSSGAIYEAENFTVKVGGAIKTSIAGYSGTGYIELRYASNRFGWSNVNVSQTQSHALTFRYSNATTSTISVGIEVAGSNVTDLVLPPTSGWNLINVNVDLVQGDNLIVIRKLATDGDINIDNMEVKPITNQAPSVSIASPLNNASFTVGENVVIDVNASDTDGSVTLVEFFEGANKIGEDNSAPFSYTWSGALEGNYDLSVIATDNGGATTTSSLVSIAIDPAPVTSQYEAENYTYRFGGAVKSSLSGFTGTGYVQLRYGSHRFGWDTVNVASNGTYTLTFRYVNSHSSAIDARIELEGIADGDISFPTTNPNNEWSTLTYDIDLTAGDNYILVRKLFNGGDLEIDNMTVQSSSNARQASQQNVGDDFSTGLEMYPNPVVAGEKLIINGLSINDQLSIRSVSGQLLYNGKANTATMEISTAGFAKGLVFVEIQSNGLIESRKIIIR